MRTEQVNLRLEVDLIAALEEVAEEEYLDRGTVIRKLLRRALAEHRLDRALRLYQGGDISIGRAAEVASISHWEIMDLMRARGIAHPLRVEDLESMLGRPKQPPRVAEAARAYRGSDGGAETLPDRPPRPGGVLLVGINPAPDSVRAGHYYQGRIGRRLWQRLQRLGLLHRAIPGAEDDAFVAAGHGLTDLVKRSTTSARELSRDELRRGAGRLAEKAGSWRPGLILFPFAEAARFATGSPRIVPGRGPRLAGVPTFLLTGPYAKRSDAERIDGELLALLAAARSGGAEDARTQRVTAKDIAAGIIRLPRAAKSLFPTTRGELAIVLRGVATSASYDPRVGPDQERSGTLRVGRDLLNRMIKPNESLRVTRAEDGTIHLD